MAFALVVGSGYSVKDDLEAVKQFGKPDIVICVNEIALTMDCDVWATLHPENLEGKGWANKRVANGFELPKIVAHKPMKYVTDVLGYRMGNSNSSGSSGLYAVKVALSMGYKRVILAGVPMQAKPHFNKPNDWTDCNCFLPTWRDNKAMLKKYVRSMSGWTKELLGYPDQEFLNSVA